MKELEFKPGAILSFVEEESHIYREIGIFLDLVRYRKKWWLLVEAHKGVLKG